MSNGFEKAVDAMRMVARSREYKSNQDLAMKRHQLQSAEFEALMNKAGVTPEDIEAGRLKLVTLYEQYLDAGLAFRAFNIELEQKIEDLTKGDKS